MTCLKKLRRHSFPICDQGKQGALNSLDQNRKSSLEISYPLDDAILMICFGLLASLTCDCKFLFSSISLQKDISESGGFIAVDSGEAGFQFW